MNNPRVTVIVPVYNAALSLKNAVASLTSQTLDDLEIILVDDASSDQSADIMRSLKEREKRVKTIFKAVNEGAHEARRSGLAQSNGRWIGFIDADDFAEPDMFRHMSDTAEDHDSDIVICGIDRFSSSGSNLGTKFRFRKNQKISNEIFQRFCRHEFGTVSLWNKLYSRPLIMKYCDQSFRWRQDINEDALVNIGCFKDARAISTLTTKYYRYTHNHASISSSTNAVDAFVGTLRAYALAVETYGHAGTDILKGIDLLYRTQLSYPGCFVEDPAMIYQHHARLAEVMTLLSDRHPVGTSALISYLGRPRRKRSTSFRAQLKIWQEESRALAQLAKIALLARFRRT